MRMFDRIKNKKNFPVTFDGVPSTDVLSVPLSGMIGVSPVAYGLIKAKVVVSLGDVVTQGQALFFDKQNPQVYGHSPVSGTIRRIVYGPKRVLDFIEIDPSPSVDPMSFPSVDVDALTPTQARSALLERGLWSCFRQRPFNAVPLSGAPCPLILVQLSNPEPFHPKLSAVIDRETDALMMGLKMLMRLTPNVVAFSDTNEAMNLDAISDITRTIRIDGDFADFNPASVLYRLKDSVDENAAWSCDWQSLIKIGRTILNNQYYNRHYVVVGGNQIPDNRHYHVTEGAAIDTIVKKQVSTDRIIFDGLFAGIHSPQSDYVPIGVDAINIIDNLPEPEFMSFLQVGANKPSFSRAYLSGFFNRFRPTPVSTALNGGHRDCISCGYCETVCPVDLLPQVLLRNLNEGDVEESMHHGLLDCATCGVCTYVCPSKIDLSSVFSNAHRQLYKEVHPL